jgi:hypothetical protein
VSAGFRHQGTGGVEIAFDLALPDQHLIECITAAVGNIQTGDAQFRFIVNGWRGRSLATAIFCAEPGQGPGQQRQ